MKELIIYSLSSYIITVVVTASSLFEPFRRWFMAKTPRLKIGNNRHPIECRLCFTFYSSVLVCNTDFKFILPVYGLAYFLATQERK